MSIQNICKRIAAAGLTLALLLSGLAACGKKESVPAAEAMPEAAEGAAAAEATPIAGSGGSILGLHAAEAQETNDALVREGLRDFSPVSSYFSGGYAWYSCKDSEGAKYYALVNKDGAVVYYCTEKAAGYNHEIVDGYAYIRTDRIISVLDMDGNILSTLTMDGDHRIEAYGGGYVLVHEAAIGFDASEEHYLVYGADGSLLATVGQSEIKGMLSEDWYSVDTFSYAKGGVFHARYYDYYDNNNEYYFTLSADGSLAWQTHEEAIKQALSRDDGVLTYHNYETGEAYAIPDTYKDRVDRGIGNKDNEFFFLDGDRIALRLRGDDDNLYVALFDTRWNLVMEPTRYYIVMSNMGAMYGSAKGFTLSDGRLIVRTSENEDTVFDENGNPLFTLPADEVTTNRYDIIGYADGLLLLLGGSVLDRDGSTLFTPDTIDASSAWDITADLKAALDTAD